MTQRYIRVGVWVEEVGEWVTLREDLMPGHTLPIGEMICDTIYDMDPEFWEGTEVTVELQEFQQDNLVLRSKAIPKGQPYEVSEITTLTAPLNELISLQYPE